MKPRTLCAGVLLAALGGSITARANTVVLNAGYESGTLDSGISGLVATNATAPDAALASTNYARSGTYSIYHKVTLDNPAYVSDGSPRSESDALALIDTRYSPGIHGIYTFSVLLKDWQDWNTGEATPVDIVWQFKHTSGGPDAFVAVKRNQLVLRYGVSGAQLVLVNDIRPFDNQWIDVKFDILWSGTADGYIKAWVGANGAPLAQVVDVENYATFSNGTGNFGYLKWGLYRPDSSSATGSVITREVYHDNITATVVRNHSHRCGFFASVPISLSRGPTLRPDSSWRPRPTCCRQRGPAWPRHPSSSARKTKSRWVPQADGAFSACIDRNDRLRLSAARSQA
jgi:hypothetical protein